METVAVSAVLAITVDARDGLSRVSGTFARLPQRTDRAIARALRKLATWLKRQVLRAASEASAIPQRFFQRAMRYYVTLTPVGLSVWIGTNPIKAHRLGAVRWTRRMTGARAGRKLYPGSWSWGARGKTGPAILSRTSPKRLPIKIETEQPHAAVLDRLQQVEADAAARFDRLLTQELNYALNVEAARA